MKFTLAIAALLINANAMKLRVKGDDDDLSVSKLAEAEGA